MNRAVERNTYYQKLYPTVNNEDLLEFRIPSNVKANMRLSDVLLRFIIKFPKSATTGVELVPENFLGHKQFSSVEVRLNGEAVSRRNCSNEYYMSAYFQYQANYSSDYITTSCSTVGLFDTGEFETDEYKSRPSLLTKGRRGLNDDHVYDIVMPIDSTIFTSNQNLPTNTPIEISFERAQSRSSSTVAMDKDTSNIPGIFTLDDTFLLVPYVIDEEMQQSEQMAVSKPIKLKYDDYSINRFNIPKDSPNVRLANLLAGPLPQKIFYGITELESFSGSFKKSSTIFKPHGVKKMTLYVDGNVLSGFPLHVEDNAIALPYVRFQQNTNRFMNCYSSRTLQQEDFKKYHFLYSASLDPESSGSLTFEFDFNTTPDKDLVLIVCGVYERTLEIDSFRNFKHV